MGSDISFVYLRPQDAFLAKKASWGLKYTKEISDPNFTTGDVESDKQLLKNLIAFYCVLEGIFFYCGFTQILSMGPWIGFE